MVSKNLDSLLQSGSTFGLLAPALSLPIFDGGRLRAGLAGSDAEYDLAVYTQHVVQWHGDSGDRWFVAKAGMGSVPVVVVQPRA